MSAMLTGKFWDIWKVFATSSLLAEEFPDTLQIIWKVSGKTFFSFCKNAYSRSSFFSSKLLKWDLALCLLSPFRALKNQNHEKITLCITSTWVRCFVLWCLSELLDLKVLARETDPFQVVCFNVIFDVVYESLLSTHFASMSSSVIVAG